MIGVSVVLVIVSIAVLVWAEMTKRKGRQLRERAAADKARWDDISGELGALTEALNEMLDTWADNEKRGLGIRQMGWKK